MMKNATDWLCEWQENDHVYIAKPMDWYGSCISWKKHNKRDVKNNCKQKYIDAFEAVYAGKRVHAALVSSDPSKLACLPREICACYPIPSQDLQAIKC